MTTPTQDFQQIEAMRQGVDYRFEIRCRQFAFKARPLSALETVQTAQEVADRLERLPPSQRSGVVESLLMAQVMLEKASTSDVGASDFKVTQMMLERMTPDEVQFLFKQYTSICDRCNPSLETLPAARIEELVEAVKKSPKPEETLIECSFLELVNISRHLLMTAAE